MRMRSGIREARPFMGMERKERSRFRERRESLFGTCSRFAGLKFSREAGARERGLGVSGA